MFLARVTGSVVSTQKVDAMVGQKLLVVEPLRVNEKDKSELVSTGRTFICVDTVGAGEGEVVLIVQGSSARFTPQTKPLPIDCAIIGIVDSVHLGAKSIFDAKGEATEPEAKPATKAEAKKAAKEDSTLEPKEETNEDGSDPKKRGTLW